MAQRTNVHCGLVTAIAQKAKKEKCEA